MVNREDMTEIEYYLIFKRKITNRAQQHKAAQRGNNEFAVKT